MGSSIRVDHASNLRNKMKFVRALVSVDITKPLVCNAFFQNPSRIVFARRVWYDGFSKGCGCCGLKDHVFKDYPLNAPIPSQNPIVLDEDDEVDGPYL